MGKFANPTEAIDALITCFDVNSRHVEVHRGSLGSGATLPCCATPGGLLRVETGETFPPDRTPRPLTRRGNCVDMVQEIVVNYRCCFTSNTGKTAESSASLTAQGLNVILSWWELFSKVSLCSPQNQNFRFVNRVDVEPEGGCAGWTAYFEVDISHCGNG